MSAPAQDAPSVFIIDQSGVVSLEIADHDGRVHSYVVSPDPYAEGWGVILHRAGGGARYKVGRRPGRLWSCDCPDATFRARREARSCKHCTAVKGVYDLLCYLNVSPPQESRA